MKIRVKLFAAYREAAGWEERSLDWEGEPSAGEIWEHVRKEMRGIQPRSPLVAVNEKHAAMDAEVRDGDELAFFPPVSGGSDDPETCLWADPHDLVVEAPIDIAALARRLVRPDCGALCTFVGMVRDHHEGRAVEAVSYEAYAGMAGGELARLCREAEQKWPGVRAAAVHRTGRLEIGEVSVAVLAAAPHRAQSFEAARFLIEEIKKSVPVWKKDHFEAGDSTWRDV